MGSFIDRQDIINDLTTNIAKKYFDTDNLDQNRVSVYGYLTEAMGKSIEDTLNINVTRAQNYVPELAANETIVKETAKLRDISIASAVPSEATALISIVKEDILNRGDMDTNGIVSFYIDKRSNIVNNNIYYSLLSDILVRAVPSEKGYVYSASYIDSINSYIQSYDDYIDDTPVLNIIANIQQTKYNIQEQVVLDTVEFMYSGLGFEYNDHLAGFNLFYKIGANGIYKEIDSRYYLIDAKTENTDSLYYNDDIPSTVYILNNPILNFTSNTYIKIEMKETLGKDGIITLGIGETSFELYKDSAYTYAGVTIYADIIDSASTGSNGDTLSDIKYNLIRAKTYRENITTDNDIINYIDDKNADVKIIKKRIDIIDRLYNLYTLLRNGSEIVPATTKDLLLGEVDFDRIDKNTGIKMLYSNNKFIVGLDDKIRKTDINNSDERCLCLPYLTVFDSSNIPYYYFQTINEEYGLSPLTNNINNPFQSICRSLVISRNQFIDSKRYTVTTTISLNTSNDSNYVDETGAILDLTSLVGFILFKNDNDVVSYVKLSLVSYDSTTRIFTLSGSFTTDDYITDDKKIHIDGGMKETKTENDFLGLIDYADITFDLYFFSKKDPDISYEKLTGNEIYEYIPSLTNYDYMNSYSNYYEHANLLIELNSFSRSDAATYKNGATTYDVIDGTITPIANINSFSVDEFDYIRDYIVISINSEIQKFGIDYYITSDGIFFRNKVIPVNTPILYYIYKNYDDASLLYFERSQHIIADGVTKFKVNGYNPTLDIIQISSPKYGILIPTTEYTVDSDNFATITIPVLDGDVFEVCLFKNNTVNSYNLPLIENTTYARITNGYYDLIITPDLNFDYQLENDYITVSLSENGRPLINGVDYYILYDSTIRIMNKYVIPGNHLYLNVIKNYKGHKNIITGSIVPPDDLVVVPEFNQVTDTIELYHKGSLLTKDIDFTINADNSISLLTFTIKTRKEIMYRLFKNIALISYVVDKDYVTISGKYTPAQLNIDKIYIPNYIHNEDGIKIIKNGLTLINPDDYIIADDGGIEFINTSVSIGDTVLYEIVKVYDITNKLKITELSITSTAITTDIEIGDIGENSYIDVDIYQTPLRILEDYELIDNHLLHFLKGPINIGDTINVRLYKTENQYGDIVKIVHEEVDITSDSTDYIPLASYDHEKDVLLNVNYNQTALIPGRDYINKLNSINISVYSFKGSDVPIVISDFSNDHDFIRLFVNNKILVLNRDYTITDNLIYINSIVSTDTVRILRYTNLKDSQYANYYTYETVISQDGQKYIYNYNTAIINAIYYKGKVLRRNIDYTYNDNSINLYNISTKKDDLFVIECINVLDSNFILDTSYYTYNSGMAINIPNYSSENDYVVVNYNGQILFNNIDYTINNNILVLNSIHPLDGEIFHYSIIKNYHIIFDEIIDGIALKGLKLNTGDLIDVSIVQPVMSDFEIQTSQFTPNINGFIGKIYVDGYNYSTDYLLINYNQTILIDGEHYIRNIDNSVSINATLDTNDTLYFIIVKNIREALDVYNGYVSGPENLMVIPNFNKAYDKLELIVDKSLLREVVNYTIDANSKVIFKDFEVTSESIANYKVFKYYYGDENGRYTIKLTETPMIQYNYLKNNIMPVYEEIVKIKDTYTSLMQLITGFDINLKFTSTYGKSKYIYIMDENLNNLNPVLKFRVYGRDIDVLELKEFIIDYFRNTYISDNTIFISNICRSIENSFAKVRGITYLGTDGFNPLYQKIFYKKPDLSTANALMAYVPECLNITNLIIEVEEI